MRFLVDRCAGRKLATWLREQGHDAFDAGTLETDPGDLALLEYAVREDRIVVTLDGDFAKLVFLEKVAHRGLVRLPDVPVSERIRLMNTILERHSGELGAGAVVTVRGERIRISSVPPSA